MSVVRDSAVVKKIMRKDLSGYIPIDACFMYFNLNTSVTYFYLLVLLASLIMLKLLFSEF